MENGLLEMYITEEMGLILEERGRDPMRVSRK